MPYFVSKYRRDKEINSALSSQLLFIALLVSVSSEAPCHVAFRTKIGAFGWRQISSRLEKHTIGSRATLWCCIQRQSYFSFGVFDVDPLNVIPPLRFREEGSVTRMRSPHPHLMWRNWSKPQLKEIRILYKLIWVDKTFTHFSRLFE